MAKKDTELVDRLRRAGLRRKAAKALSEATQSASKKARRTARAAAGELRAVAEEIERRVPAAAQTSTGADAEPTTPTGTPTASDAHFPEPRAPASSEPETTSSAGEESR